MALMLPSVSAQTGRLADVLTSCLASVQSLPNPLKLPAARSAIVVLVDGLGVDNLRARAGHARSLLSGFAKRDVIETVFPATTAAALASLTTGVGPSEHGVLGYAVREEGTGGIRNMLSDWGSGPHAQTALPMPTVFERATELGLAATVVGSPSYANSGFTHAVLHGAVYRSAKSLDDRVREALAAAAGPGLVYLYIPELDQAAHRHGWESASWLAELEAVDAAWTELERGLPATCGALLTADHGVLDVPGHAQLVINERAPELAEEITLVAGDPRVLYLWGSWPEATARALAARSWQDALGDAVDVLSREQAIEAGLFDQLPPEWAQRVGDLLLIARSRVAMYDSRFASAASRSMIGQHGALSDTERRVPLIRAGAFAR